MGNASPLPRKNPPQCHRDFPAHSTLPPVFWDDRLDSYDPYYRRSLIKFDLTALAGQVASIQSATLRFYMNALNGAGTIDLYRVAPANANWVEGTGVATGNNGYGSSTWASKIEGVASWASGTSGMSLSGSDYLPTPVSSMSYGISNHAGDMVDFNLNETAFLQDWIAGDNAGLFLRQADEIVAQNWVSLYSSEAGINYPTASASITLRPSLIVNYTATVPEPSCALLMALGIGCGLMACRRCMR